MYSVGRKVSLEVGLDYVCPQVCRPPSQCWKSASLDNPMKACSCSAQEGCERKMGSLKVVLARWAHH